MKFLYLKLITFFLVFHFTGLNAQDYPLNKEVKIYFDKSQSPVEESKLTGDVFYFNKKKVD